MSTLRVDAAGHALGRAQVAPGQRRDLRDGQRDLRGCQNCAGEVRGGGEEVGLLEREGLVPRTREQVEAGEAVVKERQARAARIDQGRRGGGE